MQEITIETITATDAGYAQVWQLREEVLRKPLGMSLKNEHLDMDFEDVIFVAKSGEDVIGCLMLHHATDSVLKLRQMAVYDAWQGKNVGRQLVTSAEHYATGKGYKTIALHARIVARDFYTKLGYLPEGELFTEVGIPHVKMTKSI